MTPGISRFRYLIFFGLLVLALAALVGAASQATASVPARLSAVPHDGTENLPPGAAVQTVLPNMNQPIAMALDPVGRMFYTERNTGRVRLFQNGTLQTTPVITFTVNNTGERGLLGIAIDPDFNTNHYIYVYYSCSDAGGCPSPNWENRVVRFVENNGVGSSPTVIFTSPDSTGSSNHNGGNIHFGPDGKLYISIGDDAVAANAQAVNVKNGKMHRINPDGTIPPGQPVFTQSGALPSLYAMGLRNSFDFTFDPLTPGRIFASENGPGCDDEMNRIEAGYNYGWRGVCEDNNPSPTYNTIRPLWYLGTGADPCCDAPTGATVYTGHQIPQWTNHLFMANYNGLGQLRHMYLNPDRTLVLTTNVVLGVTPNTDLITGPDGSFWFIDGGGYGTGTLYRISGTGGTQTPTSVAGNTATATRTATVPPTITSTPCPGAVTTQVDIIDFAFIPPIQTIHVGDTIRWTNSGAAPHTATSDTGVWDSGNMSNGDEFSFTFTTPGDYEYHCEVHTFMTGTISVLAGCAPTATTVPSTATTTRTATPIPSSSTPAPTVTGTPPTATPTPIASNTAVASNTPLNTAVASSTPINTPEISPTVPEATFTAIPSSTVTQVPGVTGTAISTNTPVPPMPTATTCSLRFMDVPASNTFYPFVQCLACRGIIGGYPCGTVTTEPCNAARDPYFRPNNNITRGQIAKIVSESARFSENPGAQIYEDVPSTNTFYAWINRLSMRGHMGGYPCGTTSGEPCILPGNRPYFRPNANATRGQLAKIVSNAAGFAEAHTGQIFTDVEQDNPFYVWIQRLASRGVMSGYPCGTVPQETCDNQNRPYFRWANEVTRGQASKIVSNTFFPNCEDPTPTSTPVPTNTPMPTSTPVADLDVMIENFEYAPQNITVTVGSTVRWTNLDLDYHTVTSCIRDPKSEACSPSGAFDSGHIDQNEQWQYTFSSLSPGTYEYYCIPHPYMTGTVTLLPVLVR
jgi:glucose/arabinose dehydrogenase/plastocyanin